MWVWEWNLGPLGEQSELLNVEHLSSPEKKEFRDAEDHIFKGLYYNKLSWGRGAGQ